MKFTFAPEAAPLAGYTIKRAIDRGGFGEVYYALSDSGKEVALKLLQRNQQVELRGVRQCLNLKHPNLVTIFDIKSDAEDDSWVVMEFVSGKSLEQVLEDHPKGLPIAEVEAWLSGMAAGIGFLHDRGIVHRDLKPANVFRENGVVKIGDVGLSKFITPSRRSAQTESVGTVYYMAPEVAHGKYGSELDVYSLGIMLYELLTGQVPFNGESTGEILMKHMTEAPDLTRIAAQFRPVLARALEKDPQRRTPGAMVLADEFRRAVQGLPVGEHAAAARPVNGKAVGGEPSGHAHTLPYPLASGPPSPAGSAPKTATPQTGKQFFAEEVRRNPWLVLALGFVFLFVFPGVAAHVGWRGGPFVPMGSTAAFVYLIYWFVKHYHKLTNAPGGPAGNGRNPVPAGRSPQTAGPDPIAAMKPLAPVIAVPVAKFVPKVVPPKKGPPQFSPATVRSIDLRTRLGGLSSSMALAVFWTVPATFLAALAAKYWSVLGPGAVNTLADPASIGLFGLTTVLGSWAVLLPAKLREGGGAETTPRRLIATALGAAVGACAFWLDQSLMVEPRFNSVFPGLFSSIGQFPLLGASRDPTLAGFVTFFAALFALLHWWWQADGFRSRRLKVSSALASGLMAFFIPALFVFPQGWGVCWAVAISLVVQLSAPWVSPGHRHGFVDDKPVV
ncbi:MAG: serine/threonine protein kinase [Planctomycetaceae bacterium]|nr:serine/threonine protein kinase [Planctomycetaceae bacterium]